MSILKSFIDSYYTDAEATYAESQAKILEGEDYNNLVDRLGLVTVVHAVVLFLLGIANSFKSNKTKFTIMADSVFALIFALIMIIGVPVLTVSYFEQNFSILANKRII